MRGRREKKKRRSQVSLATLTTESSFYRRIMMDLTLWKFYVFWKSNLHHALGNVERWIEKDEDGVSGGGDRTLVERPR